MVLLQAMSQPNPDPTPPQVAPPEPPAEDPSRPWRPWWKDVVELLHRAAQIAAEHGADTDQFMQAAWVACLDARPGLREELADKELLAQLEMLRQRGLVGNA